MNSDSESSGSSESEGWIDVDSDGDHNLDISDSEDDKPTKTGNAAVLKENVESQSENVPRVSTLATTKVNFVHNKDYLCISHPQQILTPADFALLNDLRIKAATDAVQAGGGSSTKRKLAALEATKKAMSNQNSGVMSDTFVSEYDILGPRKKAKADYEERIASIQKGREGREKFGSAKGKKKKDAPSSSTNREKARNKPIMMIMASGAVRGKKKASLRDKQKKLRAHVERSKTGG